MGSVTNLAEHIASRKRSIIPATNEAFERAWSAFPETGRRRSSRIEAWPAWKVVCRSLAEEELVAAVIAFAKDPSERANEHGPPGFHRWLKWGRWEHWLGKELPAPPKPKRFPDESVRASFYERFADPRARRWIDYAGWDSEARKITEANPAKAEWIEGPFAKWARENDIRGLSFKRIG